MSHASPESCFAEYLRNRETLCGANSEEIGDPGETFHTDHQISTYPGSDLSGANSTTKEWVRIAPYGEHPLVIGYDEKGEPITVIQRFDITAANAMVSKFNSSVNRLLRSVGIRKGFIPGYLGHPDDGTFSGKPGHEDHTQIVKFHGLEARHDGLYGLREWTEEGMSAANGEPMVFSPRWQMRITDRANAIYSPYKLMSVGIVPRGNFKDKACAANAALDYHPEKNHNHNSIMRELIENILRLLGFDEDRIQATLEDRADRVSLTEVKAAFNTREQETSAANSARESAEADRDNIRTDLQKQIDDLTAANTAERGARVELLVAPLVADGTITGANAQGVRDELSAANSDDEIEAVLAKHKADHAGVKTAANAAASDLSQRRGNGSARERWQRAVTDEMSASNCGRHIAEDRLLGRPETLAIYKEWQEEGRTG
ncbi:MAG: hypothetical protein JJT75_15095 [Opitutales bacterium]|nr:hypothetical protein [Opitutales bacterium]